LFKTDSPGGTVTASDVLYHEISDFKERTKAKIIVSMMDIAASGAYYISLPADRIMAHPTTVTGSVGVIFMRPKVGGLMDKIGVGVDVKKFGKNKDMGSPFRESNQEEQLLLQNLVDDLGNRFISLVQKHRKPSPDALSEIATARVFLAEQALKLGLIDKIGYLSDAVKESQTLAGLSEDAKVVVYRRTQFPEDNLYNTAGVESVGMSPLINIELPEYMTPSAGFYYLWNAASISE
jgi:protease IV